MLSQLFSRSKSDFRFWRQIQISPKILPFRANISGHGPKSKNPRCGRLDKSVPVTKNRLTLACQLDSNLQKFLECIAYIPLKICLAFDRSLQKVNSVTHQLIEPQGLIEHQTTIYKARLPESG